MGIISDHGDGNTPSEHAAIVLTDAAFPTLVLRTALACWLRPCSACWQLMLAGNCATAISFHPSQRGTYGLGGIGSSLRLVGRQPGLVAGELKSVGIRAVLPQAGKDVAAVEQVSVPQALLCATRLLTFELGTHQRAVEDDDGARRPSVRAGVGHRLNDVGHFVAVRIDMQ